MQIHHCNFLNVISANVNSISKNLTGLLTDLQAHKINFDLLVLTETKLTDDINNLYDIPYYDYISLHRSRRGGGIRIYYRTTLCVNVCDTLTGNFETHDALFVRLSLKSFSLIIGGIYRSPRLSINAFNEYVEDNLLADPIVVNAKCLLLGDFNLNIDSNYVWPARIKKFVQIMKENGYKQYVDAKTRCCHTTGLPVSLLDHAWANFDRDFKIYILPKVTDHMPVHVCFNINEDVTIITNKFRDFSMDNVNLFAQKCREVMQSFSIDMTAAPQVEFNRLLRFLKSVLNRFFPIKSKQISLKRINMPWLNSRVIKLINKKHKLFLALKRGYITYNYFKYYSNLLAHLIQRLKKDYFKFKFLNVANDSKKNWDLINMVYGRKKKRTIKLIKLPNNSTTSDKQVIAEVFNDYFSNIPVETHRNIKKSRLDYGHLIPVSNKSIYFQPALPDKILNIINKSIKKGGGLDMPAKFVNLISNYLSIFLADIFNLCLKYGYYPDELKIGRLVPVFKKGNATVVVNYRPICILPLINKIFEKIIYSRLDQFVTSENILSKNQFGFRKKKDTQQATLKLIYYVLDNYLLGNITACIFLDFSKAFDTIDRDLLLQKLDRYGIRGGCYNLIKDYLRSRKQYTVIDGACSSISDSKLGVPQGSCLGPLLFIIYTNDINLLLNSLSMILFADDTTVLVSCKDPHLLSIRATFYLSKLYDWCNYNKLSLNSSKTNCMLFNARSLVIPNIMIDNADVEIVNKIKYLGFNLDSRLCHRDHVNSLVSKLKRLKYVTFQIRKYMCLSSAKTFYFGMVYSNVMYGILVWGGTVTSASFKKLEKNYNAIVYNLFATQTETRNEISQILNRNNLLSIKNIYKFNACLTVYRILHENYLPFLHKYLVDLTYNHSYHTRYRNNFRLPVPRIVAIQNNFIYQALNAWNNLSLELRCITSRNLFESNLKLFLTEDNS